VVDGVASAIGTEAFHHLQDLAGMIGLFEHDAGGRDTLLDTRRVVDDIGKTGGTRQLAIDEACHQAQQFATIARRHIVRGG